MRNIEFKAELRDPRLARSVAKSLGALEAETIEQTDTYFSVPDARFKKRETPASSPEFIYYTRPNAAQPRESRYMIYSQEQADARFGAAGLPIRAVVKKTRDVLLLKNIRIHIDNVDQLGWFIEFEAIVSDEYPAERCHQQIRELRDDLAPCMGEPISKSYVDLIEQQSA